MEFKGTKNWRIRSVQDGFFFIEADLQDAEKNGYYPRVEVMQEDFGEHNGYTYRIRKADAKLISHAPKLLDALHEIVCAFENNELKDVSFAKELIKSATEVTNG